MKGGWQRRPTRIDFYVFNDVAYFFLATAAEVVFRPDKLLFVAAPVIEALFLSPLCSFPHKEETL